MATAVVLAGVTNYLIVPRYFRRSEKAQTVFAYIAGLEFGLGLFISGMADPAKVLRFFAPLTDLSRFDPSLALIIVFGIGPSLVTYLSAKPGLRTGKKEDETTAVAPTLAQNWRLPTATVADIDWRFVAGAVAFGLAWGLRGVCPGPAVLRSVLQPAWGVVEMMGYMLGSLL